MARIAEVVKCRSEPDFQMSVLRCLLTEPGSFMFDSVTSTKSVSAIVYNVSNGSSNQHVGLYFTPLLYADVQ